MTYEYSCNNGHITELRRSMSDRDNPVKCGECGGAAALIPSLTAGFVGVRNRVEPPKTEHTENAKTFRYVDGLCEACANKTTVFLDDAGNPEPTECEHCGGSTFTYSHPKPVQSSVTYPYYNRGLGCIITSPGHLRRVMREQGVVDADPTDILNAAERAASARAAAAAAQKADVDKMMSVPEHQRILNSAWYRDLAANAVKEAIGDNPNISVSVNPQGVSP